MNKKLNRVEVTRKLSFSQKMVLRLISLMKKKGIHMALFAKKETGFYREHYKHISLDKKTPLSKLPPVTKKEISRVLPGSMLADSLKNKVFKYAETTGSTGNPTPSFYTKKEFKGSEVLSKITPFQSQLKNLLARNRNAVCGLACGFTIAGASFQQILDSMGFCTVNVDARTTIAPPYRVARLLARYLPSVIVAGETDFLAWMKICKEEFPAQYPAVVNSLKVLVSTAELCSQARSRRIAEEFSVIHIDNYACVEGYFSLACPCGEKHILPIYETEVLSEDLSQTYEYGTGRFAFTNCLRKSTPFVRYLLDDYVEIYRSRCPYGFKKSIRPYGRYELTVKIAGKRYGTAHFEEVLFSHDLFGEYTVEIFEKEIRVTAEAYREWNMSSKEIIEKSFLDHFGMKTNCKIVEYGSLRNYHEIRYSKPILRLLDKRGNGTQEIPKFL